MRWTNKGQFRTFPYMHTEQADLIGGYVVEAKRILEYGSGGSTAWLAQLAPAATIISVEHDRRWFDKVKKMLATLHAAGIEMGKPALLLKDPMNGYAEFDGDPQFDVVIVDGHHESRPECLRCGYALLHSGGTIFLHDAQEELYHQAMKDVVAEGAEPFHFSVNYTGQYPCGLWGATKP